MSACDQTAEALNRLVCKIGGNVVLPPIEDQTAEALNRLVCKIGGNVVLPPIEDQTAEALNRLVCSIGPPHENAATGILGRKFSRPTAQNGAFDGVMPETRLRPAEQNAPQRRPCEQTRRSPQLAPTRFGSRGDHVRPWPDAEPTRRVTQRAKTSNPPPDRPSFGPGWPAERFSRPARYPDTPPKSRVSQHLVGITLPAVRFVS